MIQYALHHKYQPQQLSKMRGLEKYHPLFRSMIVKKRIFQLLITGDVGTGKSTLAMNLFRSVFCKHLIDFDACMQCDTCLEIGNGCGYGRKLHGSYLTGKEKEHYDQIWTEFAYCGFWAGGPFVWLDDADLMGSQILDRLIYPS